MDSGDAQVLMNAIDNAKLHQVNQEAGDSDRNTADRSSELQLAGS